MTKQPKSFFEKIKDVLGVIGIITLVVFQLGTLALGYLAYSKSTENGKKTDEIHLMVNSNLDSFKKDLSEARKLIEQLKEKNDSNKQIIKDFEK